MRIGETRLYPVYLDLVGRPVLIVGGGNVALEKLNSLVPTDADITLISPELNDEVRAFVESGRVRHEPREFVAPDVEAYFMVIAATDDPEVNRAVFEAGERRRMLANSVDDPENCNFIMAAIVSRGPMQAAVSSAGCSPALAQRVRRRIAEEILTEELGQLAATMGEWRPRLKQELPTYRHRQGFWERLLNSPIAELIRTDPEGAVAEIEKAIVWAKARPGCMTCGAWASGFACHCPGGA